MASLLSGNGTGCGVVLGVAEVVERTELEVEVKLSRACALYRLLFFERAVPL